jgi:hypothetical protein
MGDFKIARGGGVIRRDQCVGQRIKYARISRFSRHFARREVALGQYLEMCSHFFEHALPPPAIPLSLVPALLFHSGSYEDLIDSDNSIYHFSLPEYL